MHLLHPADLLKKLPDLVYPENLYCACCGDLIDRKTRIHNLCDSCIEKITWISDNPYSSSMNDFAFDDLFSCCIYGYYPRQMIVKLKFHNARYLAKPMAKLMAERVLLSFGGSREKIQKSFDCISYIPVSKEKLKTRGFNQAQLLAKYLSRELDLPLKSLLIKPRETPSVKLAGKNERMDILKGAFEIDPRAKNISGLRVLLADDVLTTGSTANEAALTLKNAGCKTICIAVFASGDGLKH